MPFLAALDHRFKPDDDPEKLEVSCLVLGVMLNGTEPSRMVVRFCIVPCSAQIKPSPARKNNVAGG